MTWGTNPWDKPTKIVLLVGQAQLQKFKSKIWRNIMTQALGLRLELHLNLEQKMDGFNYPFARHLLSQLIMLRDTSSLYTDSDSYHSELTDIAEATGIQLSLQIFADSHQIDWYSSWAKSSKEEPPIYRLINTAEIFLQNLESSSSCLNGK